MSIYFLFLESLGTPELMLIMLVALIVFGPRKLPQIGRTIGKYTAEFKRASQDFRETWEREVRESESDEKAKAPTPATETSLAKLEADFTPNPNGVENTVGRSYSRTRSAENPGDFAAASKAENDLLAPPQVRKIEGADFPLLTDAGPAHQETEIVETAPTLRKRDWL